MIKAQYINLNMIPSGVMPVLYCSQYDVGRPLGMVVYNGSEAVDLSTYAVTIEGTRTDGTPITAAVTTDGNIGAFETTATMTNVPDFYKTQLVLTDGSGKRVASIRFMMKVLEAAMNENSEGIQEDASLYQQYTGTVQTLISAVRADLIAEANRASAAEAAEASARASADASLQSAIASEASTRAAADQNLQAQVNQIIAPSGEAPSAAEVQNARIGADNVTYPTLGDAIRTQVTDLKNQIDDALNPSTGLYNLCQGIQKGKFWVAWNNGDTVTLTDNASYVAATVDVSGVSAITLNRMWDNNSFCFFADANNKRIGLVRDYQITGVDYAYTVPTGAVYAYLSQNITTEPQKTYIDTEGIVVLSGNESIVGQATTADYPYGGSADKEYYADDLRMQSVSSKKLSEILPPLDGLSDIVIKSTATVYHRSDLPDYDDAPDNSLVTILYPASTPSADLPLHYPTSEVIPGISQLITCLSSDGNMKVQLFRNAVQCITYSRMYTVGNGWQAWHKPAASGSGVKRYTCLKDGTGDFDSLVTAINTVCEEMDAELFVGPGTWDIVAELGETYTNAVSSSPTTWGLVLKNRVHIICSSNSVITAKYTGSNSNVKTYFSAFNAGEYGFTLENANIETDNTRYSVHDDRGADGGEGYFNRYINCSMKHTNGMYSDCIGGGLGTNGTIEIKDCYFEGDPEDSRLVYYHGNNYSGQTNAQCKIVVTGNYFAGIGTFGLTKYGDSTKVSTAYVSNNSVGSPLFVNSGSYAPQDNMRMIEWNNIVRS